MMRNGGHILLIIAALLSLAACETTLEVDLPDHEPVLVVNSLFQADRLWTIILTHSLPLAADPPAYVRNATVVVRSDGRIIDTLGIQYRNPGTEYKYYAGEYSSSSHRPAPGQTYTLRVSTPGYEPVTATSRVPEPVPFTVRVRPTGEVPREYKITVRFTDPAGEANHYLLFRRVHVVEQRDSTREVRVVARGFSSADPIFFGENYDCALDDSGVPRYWRYANGRPAAPAIFDDTGIDGETYEIEVTGRLRPPLGDERYTLKHFMLLVSLSEPYFRFKKSTRCGFEFEEGNPFFEPARLYSNVKGGFGIFAGSSMARRRIETTGGE